MKTSYKKASALQSEFNGLYKCDEINNSLANASRLLNIVERLQNRLKAKNYPKRASSVLKQTIHFTTAITSKKRDEVN